MLRSLITFMAQNKKQKGQGMVEYALIIALIAVLLIGSLGLLRGGIAQAFTNIINGLAGGGQ